MSAPPIYGPPVYAAPHHESGFIWWFIIIIVIFIIIFIILWFTGASQTVWWVVIGIAVFIFIIFLFVWLLWPSPHPVPVPMGRPGTTIIDQQQYHDHLHYNEYPTTVVAAPEPPEPTIAVEAEVTLPPPPEQVPIVPIGKSGVAGVMKQQFRNGNNAAALAVGGPNIPVRRSSTVVPGPTSFDPRPTVTATQLPATTRQATVNHSQLGQVTGQLTQSGGTVYNYEDYGNHKVNVVPGGYQGPPPGFQQRRGTTTTYTYPGGPQQGYGRPPPGYAQGPPPGYTQGYPPPQFGAGYGR